MRESTTAIEGPLKVSKLHKIPVLLDAEELKSLLDSLPKPIFFYHIQGLCKRGEGVMSIDDFYKTYLDYITALKAGFETPLAATMLSHSEEILYAQPIEETFQLIKATKPVINVQENKILYSKESGEFKSLVLGRETISWGLHFSYPQLFQDPRSHAIFDVDESFPNTHLFSELQKWIRSNTLPTPFIVDGKRKNVPIRIGKQCLKWVQNHPGLKRAGITVHNF